ncbi:hypothetical protein IMX26_05190 [Clostridium sp. 'deep sea']|uniref:hypothetical protein n=1 Tax=Clostridium sp. 'deep sea' TaxID=2779445 RepID=UPI0018967DBA|nr:hypothetical protein [Clostridium sp. 'deep sea']QOR36209.1 hypothetical protein IMX26_05190 [Clostridium sp. 'deep sea']
MKKSIIILSILIILLTIITTSFGLFYTDEGKSFYVENVNGDTVKIFGNGIYANESYFKAAIDKGTDAIMLLIVLPLFTLTVLLSKKNSLKIKLLHLGLLSCILYYSASISFAVAYNRLFIVYLLLFSASLFTFIIEINNIDLKRMQDSIILNIPHKSVIIFLMLAGLSVFVWLIEIIGSLKTGNPPGVIGINTTEPTFILDIGIIAPCAFYTAFLVYKKKPVGYLFATTLLTLNAIVGLIVISQSIFQHSYGILISLEEFIPYVMVFVVMSLAAIVINTKIIKSIKN